MMSRLNTVNLRIAGEYRDTWLYKQRLYLWRRSGELTYVDLDAIFRFVTRKFGASIGNAVQTLVFRNDWKVGEQFRAMMRVPEMEAAFLLPFNDCGTIVVDLPAELFLGSESEPYGGVVLDTNIYADRVYLATSEGLLESYINSRYPDRGYELNQHIDFPVARVAVRYAAINASAEDKGLHFARVRFSDGEEPGFRKANWLQVADSSLSTSYAHHNLLNYTGEAVPRFLTARVEESKTHEQARFEEKQIVGYDSETDVSSLLYSAATGGAKVSTLRREDHTPQQMSQFEVLGNSNNHLLAVLNGAVRVVSIFSTRDKELEAKPSLGYQAHSGEAMHVDDVLQTYSVSGGFLVELYDSLRLLTRHGSFQLAEGQSARVRTFASSLRHKETVAVVYEDHVSLLGFYIAEDVLF